MTARVESTHASANSNQAIDRASVHLHGMAGETARGCALMINADGVRAVLDHHITLNWADGPTLHKIAAQVRYHTPSSATSQTLRITASSRASEEPDVYMTANADIEATWIWRELGPSWCVSLSAKNVGTDDLYVDGLEMLRIDPVFGAVFGLGAPTGLWQCALPELSAEGTVQWELWSPSSGRFTRTNRLLVQPAASNRPTPPAVLFAATEGANPPVDLELELTGERFQRFTANSRTEGMLLAPGVIVASSELLIVAGDAAFELLEWFARNNPTA